jgi:hypothetical protein
MKLLSIARVCFGALTTFCSILGATQVFAETGGKLADFYKEPGRQPNRDYVNQQFGEHIDPFTGALQLHYRDIHIRGNGGFDLNISRSYNSAAMPRRSAT